MCDTVEGLHDAYFGEGGGRQAELAGSKVGVCLRTTTTSQLPQQTSFLVENSSEHRQSISAADLNISLFIYCHILIYLSFLFP